MAPLQHSIEQGLWAFIEQLPQGVACYEPQAPIDLSLPINEIFKLYLQMTCINCNSAYAHMQGYTRKTMIGIHIHEFMLDTKKNHTGLMNAIQNKTQAIHQLELHELTKTGERKYFHVDLKHEIDHNFLCRIWVHKIDITEEKKTTKKLQEQTNIYHDLFENVSDDLFVIEVTPEKRFRFLAVNPAGIQNLQLFSDVVEGRFIEEIVKEPLSTIFIEGLQHCLIEGKTLHFSRFLKFPNAPLFMAVSLFPIRHSSGRIYRILGIARDITESKKFEEHLKQEIKLKHDQAIKLQKTLESALTALGNALGQRDPYTAGHQTRVADLACAIATEMHLDKERIHWLGLAANVHDIGKIHIPAEILSKPSRLTPTEFELIKVHPESGYEILQSIDFPAPIATIVRQHHEYLDGSGYPQGLKGDAILLEAQIITVADIVESMSSHRPYRAALGIDAALAYVQGLRGTKLCAEAVDACCDLFRKKNYRFLELN